MNSSANNGFPPERSIRTDCVSAGSTARSSSDEISTAVSLSVSGGSEKRIALCRRSAHCGYRSYSSGRAAHTTMNGRSPASIRCSMNSSIGTSAQCRSSKTNTSRPS